MSSTQTESETMQTRDAWTYLAMSNEAVEALRDELVSAVPDEWERIDDSHISILPGFNLPAQEMPLVIHILESVREHYAETEIPVNGVECFHELDEDEPSFVVKLDMEIDLEAVRAEQEGVIETYGGSLKYDPVEPHVTLFKAGDGGDEHEPLSDAQRSELSEAIDNVDVPETLTVESVEAETF